MSCLVKTLKCSLLTAMVLLGAGCGVKGDPLPPEKPAEIGRGRPTYKRATEGIVIQPNHSREEEDQDVDERE